MTEEPEGWSGSKAEKDAEGDEDEDEDWDEDEDDEDDDDDLDDEEEDRENTDSPRGRSPASPWLRRAAASRAGLRRYPVGCHQLSA